MSCRTPVGRIVHNTNTGRIVGADFHEFNDEILAAKDVDVSQPQYYPIKSGKYKGKTICINRFDSSKL